MTREFKFRVWDGAQMHYMGGIHFGAGVIDLEEGSVDDIAIRSLMQYTGCKDKNDKEICEGDIIQYQYSTGYSNPVVCGIVRFGDYTAGANDYGDFEVTGFYVEQIDAHIRQDWNMREDEILRGMVIGNIYENPEQVPK